MRHVKVRVLRPFEHGGRYLSTGERIWLLTHDADVLLESGHVAVVVDGDRARQWVQSEVR